MRFFGVVYGDVMYCFCSYKSFTVRELCEKMKWNVEECSSIYPLKGRTDDKQDAVPFACTFLD